LDEAPASWILFIKFTGGFYSDYAFTNLMNGPGQVAIDERGYFWINDNYVPVNPRPDAFDLADILSNSPAVLPNHIARAGKRLLKFYPSGEPYAGMPMDICRERCGSYHRIDDLARMRSRCRCRLAGKPDLTAARFVTRAIVRNARSFTKSSKSTTPLLCSIRRHKARHCRGTYSGNSRITSSAGGLSTG
jgi:hypothetical protein